MLMSQVLIPVRALQPKLVRAQVVEAKARGMVARAPSEAQLAPVLEVQALVWAPAAPAWI